MSCEKCKGQGLVRLPPEDPNTGPADKHCDCAEGRRLLGLNPGVEVDVIKDDGQVLVTKVTSAPALLGGHTAVVWVDGISGSYLANRVHLKGALVAEDPEVALAAAKWRLDAAPVRATMEVHRLIEIGVLKLAKKDGLDEVRGAIHKAVYGLAEGVGPAIEHLAKKVKAANGRASRANQKTKALRISRRKARKARDAAREEAAVQHRRRAEKDALVARLRDKLVRQQRVIEQLHRARPADAVHLAAELYIARSNIIRRMRGLGADFFPSWGRLNPEARGCYMELATVAIRLLDVPAVAQKAIVARGAALERAAAICLQRAALAAEVFRHRDGRPEPISGALREAAHEIQALGLRGKSIQQIIVDDPMAPAPNLVDLGDRDVALSWLRQARQAMKDCAFSASMEVVSGTAAQGEVGSAGGVRREDGAGGAGAVPDQPPAAPAGDAGTGQPGPGPVPPADPRVEGAAGRDGEAEPAAGEAGEPPGDASGGAGRDAGAPDGPTADLPPAGNGPDDQAVEEDQLIEGGQPQDPVEACLENKPLLYAGPLGVGTTVALCVSGPDEVVAHIIPSEEPEPGEALAWGTALARRWNFHHDLRAALANVIPYAETRAEDLAELVEEIRAGRAAPGTEEPPGQAGTDAAAAAAKVEAAKKLLLVIETSEEGT